MRNLKLVALREYKERVAKKSFILTTLLTPLLMVGAIALVAAIMIWSDGRRSDSVVVVDNSGLVAPAMASTEQLAIEVAAPGVTVDSALRRTDVDGILIIPRDIVASPRASIKYYSNGPTSMNIENDLRHQVNDAVEQQRLEAYDIPGLTAIIEGVKSDVTLQTFRNDKDDATEQASSLSNYGVGYLLTFVLYMLILLYGQMVMQSIIEEKNNRVMEVMVSSVSPTKLMLGKIIGVASVAVTQILIWVVLSITLFGLLLPAIVPADIAAELAAYNSGQLAAADMPDRDQMMMFNALSMITNVGYLAKIAALTIGFLIGGFLLYAAVFAAVGAAVDNAQDASQLSMLAVLPTILGIMIGMTACADPNTGVAFWFSLIPFTSPMVMMARVPFGIPGWEVAVSLVVLYASVLGMVWLAAKIYRVGIFMYGKKPTLRDLARWVTYK